MDWRFLLVLIALAGAEAYRKRPEPICDPVKCAGPNCRQVSTPNGCPTCSCGPECLPPACPKRAGCEIKTIPGEPCPVCRCTDPVRPSRQCEAVQCVGAGCYYARDIDECPKCVCDTKCPAPICPMMVGCEVTIVPGETCPRCRCASQVRPVQGCDPVKCSPQCIEIQSPNGCPSCECKPQCSPPKCDEPGCEIIQLPGEPCPSCECQKPVRPVQGCDPVKCSPQCIEIQSPNGCPSCECKPQCSPPKCDEPGCEIIQLPGEPCPSCECRKPGDRPLPGCDPVQCPPGCQEVLSDRGCPSCECKPLCSPPKCDEPGCEIKQLPGEPCPSCECKKYGDRPVPVCDPPKCDDPGCQLKQLPGEPCPSCECKESECPSVDDCLSKGSMCSLRKNPDGCDSCVCRPICDPPICRRGCRIRYPQTETECPFCDCRGPVKIGKK